MLLIFRQKKNTQKKIKCKTTHKKIMLVYTNKYIYINKTGMERYSLKKNNKGVNVLQLNSK